MKLGVESDARAIHTWIYVAVATPLVVIGYLASGVLLAVAAWILSAALVQVGFVIVERRQLTKPMKDAAEQAVAAFQATYPNDEVTSVALRADEDERYVFSLRYGLGPADPAPLLRGRQDRCDCDRDQRSWSLPAKRIKVSHPSKRLRKRLRGGTEPFKRLLRLL